MNRHKKIQLEQDLFIVNLLSVALIIVLFLTPDSPLRIALGLPFALFFPGYTLICALYPEKTGLGIVERLALSLGLSLAVVPLTGLALNYTPWGIRIIPIIASLFVFTLMMSIVSFYRRAKLPIEQKYSPISIKILSWGIKKQTSKLVLAGFLIGIALVGSLTGYLASAPKVGEGFTEFYLLGSNGTLAEYPTNLTSGESGKVILGVVNHEHENVTYQIAITMDNCTVGTFNNITLSNDMSWEQNYTFTPQTTNDNVNLTFNLFKQGIDAPYRSLKLWVDVQPQK
jgi:uncharacterized membrane protein